MKEQPGNATDATSANGSASLRVELDAQVGFSVREYGGQTSYVAHHPRLARFFRIGAEEYRVACLLDGQRTILEVHQQLESEGLSWTAEDVAKFAGELVKQKLATAQAQEQPASPSNDTPSPPAPEHLPPESPGMMSVLPRYLSLAISQRFPLINGERLAKEGEKWIGGAFSRAGLIIWFMLVSSGMLVVYGNFDHFRDELQRLFDPGIWPILIGFWCVAKLIHEMGHAVCASRYGVRIGKMGIMFFLMAPLAYVDVTDAWKLRSRIQRVQIALAGVYLELAVAAIAAWAWWYLPNGLLKHLAAQVFVVAGPTTLLVNANPLLRLDGYYVLSDLLEIPNLRMHGRAQLGQRVERTMFSMPTSKSRLSGWRRPFATLHAACSVVFQVFWMGGLIVAASMWAQGLGMILAIAAFLLWGLLPFTRWVIKIWTVQPATRFGLNVYRRRLIGYLVLLLMGVQHLCTTSSPFDRRIPVVVRYQDEQISRAVTDGFVSAVYAKRGDRVSRGMLLMELSDPELIVKRDQVSDDAMLADQRAIQFRQQGEIAKSQADLENAASLKRRLAELDNEISGLQIVALRDGVVTSSDPERLLGAFVNAGDELIRVSDPNEKELLALVGERDTEAYRLAVKNRAISTVRLRGGTYLDATPDPLRPRAHRSLPHPALAATAGGPVAVEPSSDPNQSLEMTEPRLDSVTPLGPVASGKVRSGQVGMMTIRDNMPLLHRLYDRIVKSQPAIE